LNAAWLIVTSFFFFRVAVPSYRHTLWSTVSGRQWVHSSFQEYEERKKIIIFRCNKLLWESDIGAEVMEWTRLRWAEWTREQPKWFTPFVIVVLSHTFMRALLHICRWGYI